MKIALRHIALCLLAFCLLSTGQVGYACCTPVWAYHSGVVSQLGDSMHHLRLTGSAGFINDSSNYSTGYYDNTSHMYCHIAAGSVYTITLGYNPNHYAQSTQVWVDFDDDGVFSASEVVGGGSFTSLTYNCTITIPASATLTTWRPVRLRVEVEYHFHSYPNLLPCPIGTANGEMRDYYVYIDSPVAALAFTPASITFPTTTVGSCFRMDSFTINASHLSPASGNLTVSAPGGFSISPDGSTWSSSYTISYTGGTITSNKIYVEFCPSATIGYTGCVGVSGGGLSTGICGSVNGRGAAACSGTPAAGYATASPTSGGASTAFVVTVAGYSLSSGIYRNWQYSTDSGATWTDFAAAGMTDSSFSFIGISSNTCFRVHDSCGSSGANSYSTSACIAYPGSTTCGQIITTIAGIHSVGYSGDGGAATSAAMNMPSGVGVDASNNIYVSDAGNAVIRKINATGVISTFAGTGSVGFSGDGGAATSAALNNPTDVAVDAAGNVYFADYGNNRIRKVTTGGIITTVAGSGATTFSGDGGSATAAGLNGPQGIALDASGNLYIADQGAGRVRMVDTAGIITTIAGSGYFGYFGDGGMATAAGLNGPTDVAVDSGGNIYVADNGNAVIRKITPSGIITTFAGTGLVGYTGDGGAAVTATLAAPQGLATDRTGNLYIDDVLNNVVRIVNPSGTINTYAGNGSAGFSGDGGVATAATLYLASNACIDATGNLFLADQGNGNIRKVTAAVTPMVSAISGPTSACPGTSFALMDSVTGGIWSSSNTGVATISPDSGVVAGLASGSAYMTYSRTTSCGTAVAAYLVTVAPRAYASMISGTDSVCPGLNVMLRDSVAGGVWSSSGSAYATVSADSGVVTGVRAGYANITYTVSGRCGTAAATYSMHILPYTPIGPIVGPSTVGIGRSDTVTDGVAGGSWSSSDVTIATVGASTGVVTGLSAGTVTITYTTFGTCNVSDALDTITVTRRTSAPEISATLATGEPQVYPNPNDGSFTIAFPCKQSDATVVVLDLYGRVLETKCNNEKTMYINLSGHAPGIYFVKINQDGKEYIRKVVIK